MLFNGNETHLVEPTEIAIEALVEVLQHAFHPDGVKRWCNRRGITMNPSPRIPIEKIAKDPKSKKPTSVKSEMVHQKKVKNKQISAGFKNGLDLALKKAEEESAKRQKKK